VTPPGLSEKTERPAMARAGKWLTIRPRTEKELRDRLADGGFDGDEIDGAIDRLKELRLVDDDAFADQWIAERATRKGLSDRGLRAELAKKGVDPVTVDEALVRAGLDELARATDLASSRAPKIVDLPLPAQAARLQGMLLRRGFTAEVAEAAVRAVLPPEGWD
jgi:regulatory protein